MLKKAFTLMVTDSLLVVLKTPPLLTLPFLPRTRAFMFVVESRITKTKKNKKRKEVEKICDKNSISFYVIFNTI